MYFTWCWSGPHHTFPSTTARDRIKSRKYRHREKLGQLNRIAKKWLMSTALIYIYIYIYIYVYIYIYIYIYYIYIYIYIYYIYIYIYISYMQKWYPPKSATTWHKIHDFSEVIIQVPKNIHPSWAIWYIYKSCTLLWKLHNIFNQVEQYFESCNMHDILWSWINIITACMYV